MFTPRLLEDGRICCSREDALCEACLAAMGTRHASASSNPRDPYAPPDPYAAGLAQLRKAER